MEKGEFCRNLIQLTSTEPSSLSLIKIISAIFQLPTIFELREEILTYFGLPIFSKLSEAKLKYEVELCQDPRLLEAVENISKSLNDPSLQLQAEFILNFVKIILNSSNLEFVEAAVKFVTLLLAQPSFRRFIKPLLEDILFGSLIKYKGVNPDILQDFEAVFYFSIEEVSGVYYESYEDYVAAHYLKVRSLQTKLFEFPELQSLAKASQSTFSSYGTIIQNIGAMNSPQLHQILLQMGLNGYSKELPGNILIDAIASSLVLRQNVHHNQSTASIFPTEVKKAARKTHFNTFLDQFIFENNN